MSLRVGGEMTDVDFAASIAEIKEFLMVDGKVREKELKKAAQVEAKLARDTERLELARQSLRAVAEQLKRTPTRGEYEKLRKAWMPSADTLHRHYGKWPQILAMAELEPPPKWKVFTPHERCRSKKYTREGLIIDLQMRAEALGHSPRRSEIGTSVWVDDHKMACAQTYLNELGPEWNDVLRNAELPEVEEWPMLEG